MKEYVPTSVLKRSKDLLHLEHLNELALLLVGVGHVGVRLAEGWRYLKHCQRLIECDRIETRSLEPLHGNDLG